ncbi:MAG: AAA family ATPase [Limnothrix sp. BL-A-16]
MTTTTRVAEQSIPNIPGYTITEQLYLGSRTAVYRGVQDADQRAVVLKILLSDYPTFGELVQFRNQYAITKNLNLPGIIHPLNLQPLGNGYLLVMEDWGGLSLNQYLQQHTLSWVEVLKIALQLTTVLHDLHQQRVIHKDIKPANILINPESQEIKLIDFSIASLLPKETQEIQNPNILEGTLAYLAPEQTGRMNRGIDYRADFYALGVTLYQLLTGQLPFESDDPLELLHCHIAKTAQPVDQVNPSVPEMVGEIVAKLMAKNAEDRYQSALGLQHDLQQCLSQWEATGTIAVFELGQRDLSDRFLIPEKLYGRQAEVETLLNAFERVSQGNTELMLVAGFSGIGKTAVINEVHKPIVKQRGYFIKGKFDQFQRNIPFSAFVQAFRDLMGQLLSESDTQLEAWKAKILGALGDNAQVMIEVIPELVLILGSQPPAPELSGMAAQNRFNSLFQKFFRVFTTQDHPLVVFIDDLQWADAASLNLMQLLLGDTETRYLLFLGAYRDNEVSPIHPFILTLAKLKKLQVPINRINLMPLSLSSINHLVADTLSCSTELAMSLTKLVMNTAKGNPFFSTQLLKSLYEDKLIRFDRQKRCWLWDGTATMTLTLPEDVVEFMTLQLQKLPQATQEVLKLAACMGAKFDLATLAIISEQTEVEVSVALWEALQEGLILPLNKGYRFFQDGSEMPTIPESVNVPYQFLHDRIQQAAYALIPTENQQAVHLKIGRLILQNSSPEVIAERLFEVVGHLNLGIDLVDQLEEQIELVRLNLQATLKAKAALAYESALKYMLSGMKLMNDCLWSEEFNLAMDVYRERADIEFLNGNFEESHFWINQTLEKAKTSLEKADIYIRQMVLHTLSGNYPQALNSGYQAANLLGIKVPLGNPKSIIQRRMSEIEDLLVNRSIASLVDLPRMTDPVKKLSMKLFGELIPTTYLARQELFPWVNVMMVLFSMKHGLHPEGFVGFACYGMILVSETDKYQEAYEFGNVALKLSQQYNDAVQICRSCHIISSFLTIWVNHVQDSGEIKQLGGKGDLTYAGYNQAEYLANILFAGNTVAEILTEIKIVQADLKKFENQYTETITAAFRFFTMDLYGKPETTIFYQNRNFLEEDFIQYCEASKLFAGLCTHYILQLIKFYLFEDRENAYQKMCQAEALILNRRATIMVPTFYFYSCLVLTEKYLYTTPSEQKKIRKELQLKLKQIQDWAVSCAENFAHLSWAIQAEMAQISNRDSEAIELYDQAIASAHQHGFIHHEAIIHEKAAKFWQRRGKEAFANLHLNEAYYAYQRWGAIAKVADLEQRYPQLLQPIVQPAHQPLTVLETLTTIVNSTHSLDSTSHRSFIGSINQTLDLAALLQISQTFASTIDLNELLQVLTQTMMENSGADRCVLILGEGEQWQVRVMADLEGVVLPSIPLNDYSSVPSNLIQYVKNTATTVVVDDLKTDLPVIGDYLLQHQPKSVLCLPILNQGNLCAILYLENHSVSGIFTRDRVVVLNFLCTQAAISLENARLYQKSQEYSQQLEQSLHELDTTQSRFHHLVDNVPGVVYQFLMKTNGSVSMLYISNACYDLYEVTAEQAIADVQILMNMTHPEDTESHRQSIADSVHTLTPWHWEGRIITPSGKVKWIHGEARIEKLADGALVWDGLLLDISNRKEAEAALIESEAYHRTLFDQASIGLALCRMNGQLLYCNPAYAQIVGRTTDELYTLTYFEITPASYADQERLQMQRIQATGRYGPYEKEYIHKDGHLVPVRLSGILVERHGEQFIWSSVEDISDRKAAEAIIQQKSQDLENTLQELQSAQLQMVQSEKMASLGNLVAGVAHEINNPIGFLNGSINNGKEHVQDLLEHLALYQQHYPSPTSPIQDHAEDIDLEYVCEDLPQLLNSMQGATDRIKSISTSLRTFSRADTEYKVSANLHEGIDSTLLILKYRLKANANRPAIEVITNYGEIPQIDCFPGQLNQVFMNILANAIDMFDETAQGRSFKELEANPQQIMISTTLIDQQVQVSIRDNGKGMSAEVQSRIFDHLFTTKSVGKGTGLGLAIAQQIVVDKHSGSLTVESEPGQGAEFRIQLPIKS